MRKYNSAPPGDRAGSIGLGLFLMLALVGLTGPVQGELPIFQEEIDPFYTRSFDQGVALYSSGDYQDALKKFEIAAFGLVKNRTEWTRTQTYIALCRMKTDRMDGARTTLAAAMEASGEVPLTEIGLIAAAVSDLKLLQARLRIGRNSPAPTQKQESRPQIRTAPAPPVKQTAAAPDPAGRAAGGIDRAEELEAEIEASPRRTDAYYELFRLYLERGDTGKARKTLEKLTRINSLESRGFAELGRLNFSDRDYKKAENAFQGVLDLAARREIDPPVLLECRAMVILCAYYRGDRNRAAETAAGWMADLETRLDELPIELRDRSVLESLFSRVRDEQKAERDRMIIDNLKNQIRRSPTRPSGYYELYEIYRKDGRLDEARDVIRDLVRKNPREMNGLLILVKLEYGAGRTGSALDNCRRILEAEDKSQVSHEIGISALVYSILCDFKEKRTSEVRSLYGILRSIASETEISNIVSADRLTEDWNRVMAAIGL